MASIDKIYGTYEQSVQFWHWCSNNNKKALLYFIHWGAEWMEDGQRHPITCFPESIDRWMLENCPITWVIDRIKEQYNLGV